MPSTLRLAALPALLPTLFLANACTKLAATPPRADLLALTEKKPIPSDEIATDPVAEANYNASVEAWGDRLFSAGGRLCRWYEEIGVKGLMCPVAD